MVAGSLYVKNWPPCKCVTHLHVYRIKLVKVVMAWQLTAISVNATGSIELHIKSNTRSALFAASVLWQNWTAGARAAGSAS